MAACVGAWTSCHHRSNGPRFVAIGFGSRVKEAGMADAHVVEEVNFPRGAKDCTETASLWPAGEELWEDQMESKGDMTQTDECKEAGTKILEGGEGSQQTPEPF